MLQMPVHGFRFAFLATGLIAQLVTFAVCAAHSVSLAQGKETPDFPDPSPFPENNTTYLSELSVSRKHLARFEHDPRRRDLLTIVGLQVSYVGRIPEVLEIDARIPLSRRPKTSLNTDLFNGLEARNAVDLIVGLADKRQVVMINEAHDFPMHRVLTTQLLEKLYKRGFRYLAGEAFSVDPELQTRGYPTFASGSLICEPVFGEMLRTAIRLGYQIVPYESFAEMNQGEQGARMVAREEGQAKNLRDRILAKDPQAKILVHAGYSHINKRPDNVGKHEVKWLALAFKELTGIDPLCVDQTIMMERGNPDLETREYQIALDRKFVREEPVTLLPEDTKRVLETAQGKEWPVVTDLIVFHPRTRYENGRPIWLAMGGLRSPHRVKTELRPAQGHSYLAQAFYSKEVGTEIIPVDQMEYNSDEPIPTLWLPNGSFRIRVIDATGKTLHEYLTPI